MFFENKLKQSPYSKSGGSASPTVLEYDYLESGLGPSHRLASEPSTPAALPLASRRKKGEYQHQQYSQSIHSRNAGLPYKPYDDEEDDSRGLRARSIPMLQRVKTALRWPRWLAVPPLILFLFYLYIFRTPSLETPSIEQPASGTQTLAQQQQNAVLEDPTLVHEIEPVRPIVLKPAVVSSPSSPSSFINFTYVDPSEYRYGASNPHFQPPRHLLLPSFKSATPDAPALFTPLTIFTTMRDLTFMLQKSNPAEYIRTWNALTSWRRLGTTEEAPTPVVNVILFVDHPTETCSHLRDDRHLDVTNLVCEPIPCMSDEFKKPLMNCIWERAVELAKTDHMAFLNGDIVVLSDFWTVFQSTSTILPRQVMVAQRRDTPPMNWPREKLKGMVVNILVGEDEKDDEGDNVEGSAARRSADDDAGSGTTMIYEYPFDQPEWLEAFRTHITRRSRLHADTGLDLFLFHRSLFITQLPSFPAFLVGVYRWDNWLAAEWLARSGSVVVGEWDRKLGVETRAGSTDSMSLSQHPFLVLDATSSLTLLHDSLPSDHLHDLGAVHNDELVKARMGLRYKIGRVGNADVRVRKTTEEEKRYAPAGSSGLILEHNTSPERLDLLLTRAASPTGVVGFLSVSSASLSLAKNHLCWSQQRSEWPHVLLLAEDLEVYTEMWKWDVDLPILLYPNATSSTTSPAEDSISSWSGPLLWRHHLLSRAIDLGFTVLSLDPSTFFLENPIPTVEAIVRSELAWEWSRNRAVYLSSAPVSTGGDGYPVVPLCTIVSVKKSISRKTGTSAAPGDRSPGEKMFSTSFFFLRSNKYSRFFLKKLGECMHTVVHSPGAVFEKVRQAHVQAMPSRYIESRCATDVLITMQRELSNGGNGGTTEQGMKICEFPEQMWMDHAKLVEPAENPEASWLVSNDPTHVHPDLISPAQIDSSGTLLLQPVMHHVVGFAAAAAGEKAKGGRNWIWPKIVWDQWTVTSTDGVAVSLSESISSRVQAWQQAGLWCSFRPDLLRQKRIDRALASAVAASPASTVVSLSPQHSGFFLRIHLRLVPSPLLTASSLRAFLEHLQRDTVYGPLDTIDLAWEISSFWTKEEKEKDAVRKMVREKKGLTVDGASGTTAPAASTAASSASTPAPLNEEFASASVESSLATLSSDPLLWPLAQHEVLAEFRRAKWTLGMKFVHTSTIRAREQEELDATTAQTAGSAAKVPLEEAITESLRFRDGSGEWMLPYQPRDFSAAGDTPILLLTPFIRLHPSWHSWVKCQATQWTRRATPTPVSTPSISGASSSPQPLLMMDPIDRRWMGMTLLPLITTTGELQGTSTLNRSPYPSPYHILSPSSLPSLPPLRKTSQVHLVGEEWSVRERERGVEELREGGGNRTRSGRGEAVAYRTQLFQPGAGWVVFASTVQHVAAWRKAQIAAAAAATVAGSSKAPPSTKLSVPPVVDAFPPCFLRTTATTSTSSRSLLLRYLFETGSFVTAPAFHNAGGGTGPNAHQRRLAKDILAGLADRDLPRVDYAANPFAREKFTDLKDGFLPTALGTTPLFDLTGASVALPDTLAYRHLILKAAHGAGSHPSSKPQMTLRDEPPAPVDREVGCPLPPMHPKAFDAFGLAP